MVACAGIQYVGRVLQDWIPGFSLHSAKMFFFVVFLICWTMHHSLMYVFDLIPSEKDGGRLAFFASNVVRWE